MVDGNRIEGAARNVGGKIQDAVGGLAGDAKMQADGKASQIVGKAQNAAGSAADVARGYAEQISEMVEEQPLAALGLALAIGVVIGFILRR